MIVRLPEGSWWDWDVVEWNAGRLRLGAGYDLTYAHGLELVFGDPLFVVCPAAFHDPVFREPTREEEALVARCVGETPPVLVAFDADAGGTEPASCLVAAGSVEVVAGTVLRRRRAGPPGGRPASRTAGPATRPDRARDVGSGGGRPS
ncbi:hypothetical protein GCM10010420_09080 [Streptomyces glaucosporus]|uniref:Uncharacterized protein n=1 Tax=Streptomyces glaucosporus TaxID=284044 RepID=A0ABP5UUB9_9ACTN